MDSSGAAVKRTTKTVTILLLMAYLCAAALQVSAAPAAGRRAKNQLQGRVAQQQTHQAPVVRDSGEADSDDQDDAQFDAAEERRLAAGIADDGAAEQGNNELARLRAASTNANYQKNDNNDDDEDDQQDSDSDSSAPSASSAQAPEFVDDSNEPSTSGDSTEADDLLAASNLVDTISHDLYRREQPQLVDSSAHDHQVAAQQSLLRLETNIANAKVEATPTDMASAAGHHHHHHHHHGHYVHGKLEMGAETHKKGAFKWHDKHPVGGKGRR